MELKPCPLLPTLRGEGGELNGGYLARFEVAFLRITGDCCRCSNKRLYVAYIRAMPRYGGGLPRLASAAAWLGARNVALRALRVV